MFSRCLQKERTGKLTFQAGTAATGRKTIHAAFQNFVALQNCVTWVLCSDKCDGCVFWLFKRDFLSFWVLSSPYELRQSYRDVVRTIVTSMILLPYLYIWLDSALFSKVVYWLGLFSIFKVVVFLLNLRPMNLLLPSPVHQVIIIALLLHRVEMTLKFWWTITTGLCWTKKAVSYI